MADETTTEETTTGEATNGDVVNKEYVVEVGDDVIYCKAVPYKSVTSDLEDAVRIELGTDRYDDLITHYLSVAESAIVERLWPFRNDKYWEDVPWKYHNTAVQIAVYLINKRGAEGETQHTESGTSHTYESASIPASMLRGITPHVGVL